MRLHGRFGGGVTVNNDITKGVATNGLALDGDVAVLLQLKPEVSLKHTLQSNTGGITCQGISPQGTIIFQDPNMLKGRMWETETGNMHSHSSLRYCRWSLEAGSFTSVRKLCGIRLRK